MERYAITLGAATTAGGKVVGASSNGSINGARIALENDPIACPACGMTGRVMCVGPRLSETWNGKNVALENDLCVCRCAPPPRLIANQTLRCQVIGSAEMKAHEQESAAQVAVVPTPIGSDNAESYDLTFQLADEISGLPLAGRPYAIELAHGTRLEGRTDKDGMTEKITAATAEAATLKVFDADLVSINPYWDR